MGERLRDIARIVRSKNAGPTQLTLDVLFADSHSFQRGIDALSARAVARAYARDVNAVRVMVYPPALAVKIVMTRLQNAGSPGDRDIYGAQQHGPLLDLPV